MTSWKSRPADVAPTAHPKAKPPQPNVLLIIADDMGFGDMGRFNGGLSRTPALDALALEGVVLSQCYSASPVCAPARAALLTGRYPHRTGAITPQELLGLDRIALDEITIADRFRSAGYATGLIGKWHNGALDERYHPRSRGFDEFVGFSGGWMDYYDWRIESQGAPMTADGRYLTDVFTDEAVDFLRRKRAAPFFLTVAFNAPHAPLQAPQETVRGYLEAGITPAVAHIYAMVELMDRGIGRILDTLAALEMEDDTFVLFVSDNGPAMTINDSMPRPDGVGTDLRRPNIGLRGGKRFVYEGGIRVPAMLRWPAGLRGGRTVDEPVHFVDWLPTLTRAAGIPEHAPLPLDGRDVLGTLLGEAHPAPARFWQWNLYEPLAVTNAAHRDGKWKLVRPPIALRPADADGEAMLARHRALEIEHVYGRAAGHHVDMERPIWDLPVTPAVELYDLDADPGEEHDISAQHPEVVERMLRELDCWFEDVERDRHRTRSA